MCKRLTFDSSRTTSDAGIRQFQYKKITFYFFFFWGGGGGRGPPHTNPEPLYICIRARMYTSGLW